MCQCYQIGGPFIEEDPDCPIHGHGGVWETRREIEEQEASLEERISQLEDDNRSHENRIQDLEQKVLRLEKLNTKLLKTLEKVSKS